MVALLDPRTVPRNVSPCPAHRASTRCDGGKYSDVSWIADRSDGGFSMAKRKSDRNRKVASNPTNQTRAIASILRRKKKGIAAGTK